MAFLNPEKIISQLSIKKGMSVADLGCGSGGWTVPIAKEAEDGQVYAVDILEESLSALKSKLHSEKVHNVRVVRADLEKGSSLRVESVDLVVVSNVLFQAERKEDIIKEAFRILRKKGVLLVVDWIPEAENGPEGRISPQEAREMAENNGFDFLEELDAGAYHFAHVYKKD